jgi:hypothetical protein
MLSPSLSELSYDIEDSATHAADLRRGICIVNPSVGRESGLPVSLAAEWPLVTPKFACQGAWATASAGSQAA